MKVKLQYLNFSRCKQIQHVIETEEYNNSLIVFVVVPPSIILTLQAKMGALCFQSTKNFHTDDMLRICVAVMLLSPILQSFIFVLVSLIPRA